MASTTFREIITSIKNNQPSPVYLLMGEEPYFLDRIVEMLEQCVIPESERDFNSTSFYGSDTRVDILVATAQRFPMMSDRQLVILKEAQSMHQAKNQLDALASYVQKPNNSTVLAIVFKGDNLNATSAIMKAAAKNPDVIVFKSPKIKDYQLSGPIKDYCREKNLTIDDKAAAMLGDFVGNSLGKLFGEIDRLGIVLNAQRHSRITPEIVEKNIGISKDFNNFELKSALASKNYALCMRIVKHFAANPKSHSTVVTTGTLFSFFQQLTIAWFSTDKSDRGLMEALQLKSPYQLKDIKIAMANYNAMQCLHAISALREFDTRSKGIGSLQKEFELIKELIFKLITQP